MTNNRALSLLGMAARARKIITGEELVVKGIQSQKVFLVIMTTDAATNTRKKIIDKCTFYEVPYIEKFDRNELGHAIGKISRVVVGVTDKGFSKEIERLIE